MVRSALLYAAMPIALGMVSADVWRLDVSVLTAVLSAQALWALLPFLMCLRVGLRLFAVAFALALVSASSGFVLMLWAEHTFAYVPL